MKPCSRTMSTGNSWAKLDCDAAEENNITIRRQPKQTKMAERAPGYNGGVGEGTSLLIDSFLSQNEEDDIGKMLAIEGDIMGDYLPFTSTQMGGFIPKRSSLFMSPIMDKNYENPACAKRRGLVGEHDSLPLSNRFSPMNCLEELLNDANLSRDRMGGEENKEKEGTEESDGNEVAEDNGRTLHGADTIHDGTRATNVGVRPQDSLTGIRSEDRSGGEAEVAKLDAGLSKEQHDEMRKKGDDKNEGDEDDGEAERDRDDKCPIEERFQKVDTILGELGTRCKELTNTVDELRLSLEFSQKEIDTLKEENINLRLKLADQATEESRSAYQINKLEEKVDRVDTLGRRKNLILEGVPEVADGKEDVEKTIWQVFDQLNINRRMDLDACYRQGYLNRNRPRPIVVTFQKLIDRDLIYASRMGLGKTQAYKNVWINEDLGPTSKKTRNMIRLFSRQAQTEGIDCRTGKYMIQINREKFDTNNLSELPPPLHPANIKQIRLDKDTIAYQSEFAPFSNLFPVCITIGRYKFTSLEQTFQFLKAKKLKKPLAATRIYLSRDQAEIKRLGDELGTSDLWEAEKFDVMYICLKKKFEQNADLREMLLNTGNCELVEATPNRLWGCGATLSSNMLRRHEWPGENKQGKTLMTVREELRGAAAERRNTFKANETPTAERGVNALLE